MRRPAAVIAIAVAIASVSLQAEDRIFDSAVGHGCFVDLLRRAAWGIGGPYERAAFIVEQADGTVACVPWPNRHFYLEEAFNGVMPGGTIGVVHTHPVLYPRPSQHDIDEAARVGKPFYVVSIHGVYRADPESGNVATLAHGKAWIHEVPRVAAAATAGGIAGGSK